MKMNPYQRALKRLVSLYKESKKEGEDCFKDFLEKFVILGVGRRSKPDEYTGLVSTAICAANDEDLDEETRRIAKEVLCFRKEKCAEIVKELVSLYKENQKESEGHLKGFLNDVVLANIGCKRASMDSIAKKYRALYSTSMRALVEKTYDKEDELILREILKFKKDNYKEGDHGKKPCCDSRCNMKSHHGLSGYSRIL